jgi:hypothetical protein
MQAFVLTHKQEWHRTNESPVSMRAYVNRLPTGAPLATVRHGTAISSPAMA